MSQEHCYEDYDHGDLVSICYQRDEKLMECKEAFEMLDDYRCTVMKLAYTSKGKLVKTLLKELKQLLSGY